MIHNLFNLIVLLIQRFLSMIARNIAKTLWKKKFDFNNKSKRRNLMKFRSTIFHPICRNIRIGMKNHGGKFSRCQFLRYWCPPSRATEVLRARTVRKQARRRRGKERRHAWKREGDGEEREREREVEGSLSLSLSSRWEMRRHNR